MDAHEKLAERKQLFENAFDFKHNTKIPVMSNFWTWPVFDAGYNLNTALYDYSIMEKINDEFVERYQWDACIDWLSRNPLQVTKPLGGGTHHTSEDGEQLFVDDFHTFEPEDYPEFIKNPDEVYWEKIFKRYCKPGTSLENLYDSFMELIKFGEFGAKMVNKAKNEYGVLNYYGAIYQAPIEVFFDMLRGIKGTSMDIRKLDRGLLMEVFDALFYTYTKPGLDATAAAPDPEGYVAPLTFVPLAHSILSVKQFEELYWPYLSQIIGAAVDNHKRISVLMESEFIRFADFFQDVPKGTLLICLEKDDPYEFRKAMPNVAICGGMDSTLLGHGTPQENIDYAKKFIDTLGEGIVIGQNKMMSFRNDATRENLQAVMDFVHGYEA